MNHRNPEQKTRAFALTKPLTFLLALVCGVSVANLYYLQPLEAQVAASFHVSQSAAGTAVTVTQLGYAFGLLLFVPLGDMTERRGLIARMLVVTACAAASSSA